MTDGTVVHDATLARWEELARKRREVLEEEADARAQLPAAREKRADLERKLEALQDALKSAKIHERRLARLAGEGPKRGKRGKDGV